MRQKLPALSIIIPVYNEPINIEKTLTEIKKTISVPHEILVVYDTDKDTTVPVLNQLKEKYHNLSPLKNTIAKGPSGAIRTGFSQAKAPLILVTMADLCDDLTQVEKLIKLVPKKADIVCPSRYTKGGKQELKPSLKTWAPKVAGYLMSFLTGIPTVDPTNSFKLYSATLLKNLSLKSTISFSVTLEIVAKAHVMGYRIREIPTVWRDRQYGKTNFNLRRSFVAYFPWFLLSLSRNRLFHLPITYTNSAKKR